MAAQQTEAASGCSQNRHTRFIEFKDDVARCGSTHLIQYPALGLAGFSAALENRPDPSPQVKPRRQRSHHPFPKSPRLHSRYVRSDFRNGRSLRPSSSDLIRSLERDSDGFLKLESLDFCETPSPTKIGSEKRNQKPGN